MQYILLPRLKMCTMVEWKVEAQSGLLVLFNSNQEFKHLLVQFEKMCR